MEQYFTKNQFGFRSGRGTSIIIYSYLSIKDDFGTKTIQNHNQIVAFIELEKEFDKETDSFCFIA